MGNQKYETSIEDKKAWLFTAKRLHRLSKPRSPYIIEYIEDPTDDWFIYVVTIKKKTGEWTDSSMIIQKDMCHWLDFSKRQGWVEEATE